MRFNHKVLVVGTTADYIDWIQKTCPDEALFITDPFERDRAAEIRPKAADELLCNLSDTDGVLRALERHVVQYRQYIEGIACFDCESMALAAAIAEEYTLDYPSPTAVQNCRDKLRAKTLWRERGLRTPRAVSVDSSEEVLSFFEELEMPIVLKPTSGSGSEFVFDCQDGEACKHNFRTLQKGLLARRYHRLYLNDISTDSQIMAERIVFGREYSCDFVIQDGYARIIRLTQKIRALDGPFGTIQAYVLLGQIPEGINAEFFQQTIYQSAVTLGIERAICMLDFMISNGQIVLLELAPRPGGDCLPHLLRQGCHLDILKLQLDLCRHRPLEISSLNSRKPLVGLRLHANESGVLKRIGTEALAGDPRLLHIHLNRQPGQSITLPPDDYDSWVLGHIIFTPDAYPEFETQCRSFLEKLTIEME
jgi:biotin carboxylase